MHAAISRFSDYLQVYPAPSTDRINQLSEAILPNKDWLQKSP